MKEVDTVLNITDGAIRKMQEMLEGASPQSRIRVYIEGIG